MGRRARRNGLGAAVMSEVSGDAVRGFLACLFPGLIVAMTETCAILRRFENTRLNGFSWVPRTSECYGTREDQAHRQNGSTHRRGDSRV